MRAKIPTLQNIMHNELEIQRTASKSTFKGYLDPFSFLVRKGAKVQGIFSNVANFSIKNLRNKYYGRTVTLISNEKELEELVSQAKQIKRIRFERKEKPAKKSVKDSNEDLEDESSDEEEEGEENQKRNFVLKSTGFESVGGRIIVTKPIDLYKRDIKRFTVRFIRSVHLKADTKNDMDLLKYVQCVKSLNFKIREKQLEKSLRTLTGIKAKQTITLQFAEKNLIGKQNLAKHDNILTKYITIILKAAPIRICFLNFQSMSVGPSFLDWLLTAVGDLKSLDWHISARFNDRRQYSKQPNEGVIELCNKLQANQTFERLDVFAVKAERSLRDEFWDVALGDQYHPYYVSDSDFRGFLSKCSRKAKILSLVVSHDHNGLKNLLNICKSIQGIYIDYNNRLIVEDRSDLRSDDDEEEDVEDDDDDEDEDHNNSENNDDDEEEEGDEEEKTPEKRRGDKSKVEESNKGPAWMKNVKNLCIKHQFNDRDKLYYPYSHALLNIQLESLQIFYSQAISVDNAESSWTRYNISIPFEKLRGITDVKQLELAYGRKMSIEDLSNILSQFSSLQKLRLMFCGDYDNDQDCRQDKVEQVEPDLIVKKIEKRKSYEYHEEQAFPMRIPFNQLANLIKFKIEIPFARTTFFLMNGRNSEHLKGIWWDKFGEGIAKLKLLESLEVIDKNRSKLRLTIFMKLLTGFDKLRSLKRLILHTFIIGKQDEKIDPNLDTYKDQYRKGAIECDDEAGFVFDNKEISFFEQEREEKPVHQEAQLLNYSVLSEEQQQLQRQIFSFINDKPNLQEIDIQELRVGNMNRIKLIR